MNIFYAPPSNIHHGFAELTGQEAIHASKVMRVEEGDEMTIVDGRGGRFTGPIRRITKNIIQVEITNEEHVAAAKPQLILGMGIIKKRDRLEFAVEKAVELGANQVCLFGSDHTVKKNVRMDRLDAIALSAMKQSLRAWLPDICVYDSVDDLLEQFADDQCLVAHEKISADADNPQPDFQNEDRIVLLVGPEGGFSSREIDQSVQKGGQLYSLGSNRLRAETAAVAFLSQFLQ